MTPDLWIYAGIAGVFGWLSLLLLALRQSARLVTLQTRLEALQGGGERVERMVRDEMAGSRQEIGASLRQNREELAAAVQQLGHSLHTQLAEFARSQNQAADQTRRLVDEKLALALHDARQGRLEQADSLLRFGEQQAQQLGALAQRNAEAFETLRQTLEGRLAAIQADNSQKLEQMRQTVDEKLHNTLEQRLGESFKLVSERLEQVHKGLGEMQTLASGVGDLKKVLANVKVRGTWGEVQLESLLEQMLTAEQYARNVATRPGAAERVEFAIKLPGRDDDGSVVWLPIDAKFPLEDYQKLLEAQDVGDGAGMDEAARALENRVKLEARSIRDKYLEPPHTTDFGLLFLPIEGLYAEVIRRPGLSDYLQREYRVTVTGPTTLAAILNSLQMGFRTLAIEKRSGEVWKVLGAVKTEFGKFGDVLAKTRKKLDEARNTIDAAEQRTRVIDRRLKQVESLPVADATVLLGSDGLLSEEADP